MKSNRQDGPRCGSDYGPEPFVVDIESATRQNKAFRTALWTGCYLQLTLMCIKDEIGLEMHGDTDQFLRIEEGSALVMMGKSRDNLNFQTKVGKDCAIFIPAGTWHNIVNCGRKPVKLYSIYAPPHHPRGTVHRTREEAEREEHREEAVKKA
ncbi:MAG: cupin domain-containing protein [Clostridiales bacterium]|nr:cupin domain-containing protein [Clostridiales bacterium]